MKEKQATMEQEKPDAKPPTAKFKSTKETKQAARETALGLGKSVLMTLARQFDLRDEPYFQEDGLLTEETSDAVPNMASEWLYEWQDAAFA
jgi:hypothetical protein